MTNVKCPMTNDKCNDFTHADFFVLRTPLLPFNEFLIWGRGLPSKQATANSSFEQSYAESCRRLRARLESLMTHPETREAIFIACPDLIGWIENWKSNPETKRGRNTERALVRYFTRMTGRPTPFGLFAGMSVGRIGKVTSLNTEALAEYRRHTRLDFDYLLNLSNQIARHPNVKKNLIYYPNSSLYRAGGQIHYVESRRDGPGRSYQFVAFEDTDYLSATLTAASRGKKSMALAKALVDEDVSLEEAEEYIELLIENQILVPDLSVPLTGRDPLGSLIDQLNKHKKLSSVAGTLARARSQLRRIDRSGIGIEPRCYQELAQSLNHLPSQAKTSHLFHVDLIKPASKAVLGSEVLDEISRGVTILHRITPRPRIAELARFCEAFTDRYQDMEVPLAEALDEESGIGFGTGAESSPLIADLEFPTPAESRTWGSRDAFLLERLCQALTNGEDEIVLGPADIEKLSEPDLLPLPDSFAAIAKVAAASQKALDEGDFRVLLEGVSGPTGAALFGRFCYSDEELRNHVLRYVRAEQSARADAVLAEIVHMPGGGAGNVMSRPLLREFEIPYLGVSGAPPQQQIPITDLMVSVRGDRIRLRSTRLGREVIPRLTNAHHVKEQDPAVYRFLCLLQYQGIAGELIWTWGALSQAPFLPRVVSGKLVLSAARWFVNKDELQELDRESPVSRFKAIQSWRARRSIPSVVFLTDDKSALPVDLNNELSVESFAMLLRGCESATLVEMFPAADDVIARMPDDTFLHQLIVPFIKKPTPVPSTSSISSTERALSLNCRRTFPPGSEWLYAKVYTGTATSDLVLQKLVGPLGRVASRRGLIDSWFFVRYGDPDWHLRLRFHGSQRRLNSELLPLLQRSIASLMKSQQIRRFQLDTYERELERYGGAKGIVLAEKLFHADSETVLKLLEVLSRSENESIQRWQLAIYGIDLLLTDLGFDLNTKAHLIKRARDGYAREFGLQKKLRYQLSEKFRKERTKLTSLFEADGPADATVKSCLKAMRGRSKALTGVLKKLRQCDKARSLPVSLDDLALSYIHMHVNRLLESGHREQELVIYDFLTRLYDSRVAQDKLH
jgi:class I lanthipeptide synthase